MILLGVKLIKIGAKVIRHSHKIPKPDLKKLICSGWLNQKLSQKHNVFPFSV